MRTASVGVVLFAGLMLLPVVFFSIYYANLPSSFEAPILRLAALFGNLLASNAGAALSLLAAQPLVLVSHVEMDTGLRVWEVYAYLLPTLALLASALYGAAICVRSRLRGSAGFQVATGLAIIALALSYVRVAACCTGPGWIIDVWLRGLALTPVLDGGVDWSAFYQRVEGLFLPGQAALVLMGLALMRHAARRDTAPRH